MKLPKEWEAIVGDVIGDVFGVNGQGAGDAIKVAVERCYALHSKPRKELTDAEIVAIHFQFFHTGTKPLSQYIVDSHRAVIAAHEDKQREPETVKFRAARHKADGRVSMLQVICDANLASCWEWLEPPQTFEVKV